MLAGSPAMNICLHAKFQVQWCYGFDSTAFQQDKRKKKKKKKKKKKAKKEKKTKNMKKHVSLYFPDIMSKYIYF